MSFVYVAEVMLRKHPKTFSLVFLSIFWRVKNLCRRDSAHRIRRCQEESRLKRHLVWKAPVTQLRWRALGCVCGGRCWTVVFWVLWVCPLGWVENELDLFGSAVHVSVASFRAKCTLHWQGTGWTFDTGRWRLFATAPLPQHAHTPPAQSRIFWVRDVFKRVGASIGTYSTPDSVYKPPINNPRWVVYNVNVRVVVKKVVFEKRNSTGSPVGCRHKKMSCSLTIKVFDLFLFSFFEVNVRAVT